MMLWDLIQQCQISNRHNEVKSLEQRVQSLESELYTTRSLLETLMQRLEQRLGEDLDGDGKIG